jgi:hypothetical protein
LLISLNMRLHSLPKINAKTSSQSSQSIKPLTLRLD